MSSDLAAWTADDHFQVGLALLDQILAGDAAVESPRSAAVATAHFAAAQAIQTKAHRSGYQGDEAKNQTW